MLVVVVGVNILQQWDTLFPDGNGEQQQTLPCSLGKLWKKVNFSRMVYPGTLKNRCNLDELGYNLDLHGYNLDST